MKNIQQFDLKKLTFYETIKQNGGEVFLVGGIVRDFFLNKQSKDLDLVISGIPMERLEEILSNFGRVDLVGKAFGVLKFKPEGESFDYDIALPRTEKKIGDGHRGFEVSYDHNLPIAKELFRRDLKINSMAIDDEGNLIDPYGGMEDIRNKRISLTNPDSFKDDALRQIRAIQFSSRFNFEIEPNTLKSIKENAHKIKEISGERILIELEKIVNKGDKVLGLRLLVETGLFREIFGFDFHGELNDAEQARDIADFVFVMLHKNVDKPSVIFKSVLKGDVDSERKIEALSLLKDRNNGYFEYRMLVYKMNKISPISIDSNLLDDQLKGVVQEMKDGLIPLSIAHLDINGEDLMKLGLKGKEIGDALFLILSTIYKEGLKNERTEIVKFIENGRNS